MRKRHAFVPTASGRLEDRVALSQGMMPAVAAQVGRLEVGARQARTLDLRGTTFGIAVPTTGGASLMARRAFVYPLGKVTTLGSLSIQSGERTSYDGTLNLTQIFGRGTLQVRISGSQAGPASSPANLNYEITGGRGAFRGATGTGNVVLDPGLTGGGARTRFTMTFGESFPTSTTSGL